MGAGRQLMMRQGSCERVSVKEAGSMLEDRGGFEGEAMGQ